MMALRAGLEREIRPALLEKQRAEYEVFQFRFQRVTPIRKLPTPVAKKPVTDATDWPAWWKEQGRLEREAIKAENAAIAAAEKAAKKSRKATLVTA